MRFHHLDEVTHDENHREKGLGYKCTGRENELKKCNQKMTTLESEDSCSVENTKYSINRKIFLSSYTHSVDKDHQLMCHQTSLTFK